MSFAVCFRHAVFTLLCGMAVFCAPMSWAQPVLQDSSFDGYTGVLTLTFDRALDDGLFNPSSVVGLSVDNGVIETIELPLPLVLLADTFPNRVQLQVDDAITSTINAWAGLATQLELRLGSGLVTDMNGNANSSIEFINDQAVTYIPLEPRLHSASYDALTDQLSLRFNRPLGGYVYDIGAVSVSIDNGVFDVLNLTTPLQSVWSSVDDETVVLQLGWSDASTLEGWFSGLPGDPQPVLEVALASALVTGLPPSWLPSLAVDFADDIEVAYVREEPLLIEASLYEWNGILTLRFNRALDDASFDVDGLISLSTDNYFSNFRYLDRPMSAVDLSDNDNTIRLQLSTNDRDAISFFGELDTSLELEMIGFSPIILSIDGYPNLSVYYSDDIAVEYFSIGGDNDADGVLNEVDLFPHDPTESVDTDGDRVGDNADNCPGIQNILQLDTDQNGVGNRCQVFTIDGFYRGNRLSSPFAAQ